MVLLGSTRNAEDEELVKRLKQRAVDLNIQSSTEFVVNAPFTQLQALLSRSSIGIHTMWNEHFGISVVEMMAAGLVVVAHRTAGPLMDIVVPCDGVCTGAAAVTVIHALRSRLI